MQKISATDEVIAINPETNEPARMTRKAFDGVYREKGFKLVDRDNADDATAAGRPQPGNFRNVKDSKKVDDAATPGVATGGAAAIAATIGLGNEKSIDNTGEDSAGRESNKRDRGGRR